MERRFSRRCAAVVLVAAVILTGLGGLHASPARGAAASTLRIGSAQEPDSMNPFNAVLAVSYATFARVYDLLVGIGPDLSPVPQLAKSWEVAPNGTAWTFHLQTNVRWHDNQTFSSADVKFTFEYIQQCAISVFLGYLGDPTDPNSVHISAMATPDPDTIVIYTNRPKANMLSLFVFIVPEHIWSSIPCDQATTVQNSPPIGTGIYKFVEWNRGQFLRLTHNTNYFLKNANPNFDYVDEIAILFYTSTTALYNDLLAGNLDATAALTSQQWLSLPLDIDRPGGLSPSNSDADVGADLTKFKIDAITIDEIGACVASDATIAEYNDPANGTFVTGARHWLVTNWTVRGAIQTATDRNEIVRVVLSGFDEALGQNNALARPGDSLIPPATAFWHYNVTAAESYAFNLTRAAAMLSDPLGDGAPTTDAEPPNLLGSNLDFADARNKDAFADTDGDLVREVVNMTFTAAQNPQAAPHGNAAIGTASNELSFGVWLINYDQEGVDAFYLYQNGWRRIGVRVSPQVVSEEALLVVSYACDNDFYDWGFGFDVDPDFGLSVLTKGQILGWQDAWYVNPTYDQWYLDQAQKVDAKERQAIVHDMQRLAYRDAPYLIKSYPMDVTVVRSDRFTGWGDWEAHPGLGLTGFGNALVMLTLTPGGVSQPAPLPVAAFVAAGALAVIVLAATAFLLARRRKRESGPPPMAPPPPPPTPP